MEKPEKVRTHSKRLTAREHRVFPQQGTAALIQLSLGPLCDVLQTKQFGTDYWLQLHINLRDSQSFYLLLPQSYQSGFKCPIPAAAAAVSC